MTPDQLLNKINQDKSASQNVRDMAMRALQKQPLRQMGKQIQSMRTEYSIKNPMVSREPVMSLSLVSEMIGKGKNLEGMNLNKRVEETNTPDQMVPERIKNLPHKKQSVGVVTMNDEVYKRAKNISSATVINKDPYWKNMPNAIQMKKDTPRNIADLMAKAKDEARKSWTEQQVEKIKRKKDPLYRLKSFIGW